MKRLLAWCALGILFWVWAAVAAWRALSGSRGLEKFSKNYGIGPGDRST